MTIEEDKNYYINNPVFLKYKIRFDFFRWARVKSLKKAFINERIVEIPFAISWLNGISKDTKVLDLGCTESTLPLNAACMGYKVFGYDFRPYPYTHPNLTSFRGDMVQLPFKEGSFGAVMCISTLEHLGLGFYKDPERAEKADKGAKEEIKRVLARDGLLILSVPFGRKTVSEHQRVYDAAGINGLLSGFRAEDIKYFASRNSNGSLINSWEEIEEREAEQIDSGKSTQCVCLIKAFNS